MRELMPWLQLAALLGAVGWAVLLTATVNPATAVCLVALACLAPFKDRALALFGRDTTREVER